MMAHPGFYVVIEVEGELRRMALELPPLPAGASLVEIPLLAPKFWCLERYRGGNAIKSRPTFEQGVVADMVAHEVLTQAQRMPAVGLLADLPVRENWTPEPRTPQDKELWQGQMMGSWNVTRPPKEGGE